MIRHTFDHDYQVNYSSTLESDKIYKTIQWVWFSSSDSTLTYCLLLSLVHMVCTCWGKKEKLCCTWWPFHTAVTVLHSGEFISRVSEYFARLFWTHRWLFCTQQSDICIVRESKDCVCTVHEKIECPFYTGWSNVRTVRERTECLFYMRRSFFRVVTFVKW